MQQVNLGIIGGGTVGNGVFTPFTLYVKMRKSAKRDFKKLP
jgi:hypothetical protein